MTSNKKVSIVDHVKGYNFDIIFIRVHMKNDELFFNIEF